MANEVVSPTHTLASHPEGDLWDQVQAAIGCALQVLSAHEFHGEAGRLRILVVEKNTLPQRPVLRRRFRLTQREAEIAGLLADRYTNQEIATTLGISVHTARHHVEQVMGKLGVSSRHDVRPKLISAASRVAA